MSDVPHDWFAAFIGVATVATLRILDWILPRRHHLKAVDKYGVKEDE